MDERPETDEKTREYPEVDPYLLNYFQMVAPRHTWRRWAPEPVDDIWDELGDFA